MKGSLQERTKPGATDSTTEATIMKKITTTAYNTMRYGHLCVRHVNALEVPDVDVVFNQFRLLILWLGHRDARYGWPRRGLRLWRRL